MVPMEKFRRHFLLLVFAVISEASRNTRNGTKSVVKTAIRNAACSLAKLASNLLLCINGRFRINELTRLVPAPVRSVLRNDDSFSLNTNNFLLT